MAAPLFLLAPPRSFTSVINAMIGQHPQAYGLPELNLFSFEKTVDLWQSSLKEFFKLNTGLLRAVAEIYVGEQSDEAIEFAEHWCAVRENRKVGDIFNEIRERLHPLIPVDKSPGYNVDIDRLRRILDACPDANFIHLIRHPAKQCESMSAFHEGMMPFLFEAIEYQKDRALVEPQYVWYDMNITILNFLENDVPPNQQFRVIGEGLMENPEEKLGEICRWLGIRDDAQAVEEMMHPENSPFSCFGPLSALLGNDPNFLKRSRFERHVPKVPPLDAPASWRDDGSTLFPEVIELAREFGYS